MHYSSFKKGDLFENFVVDQLFKPSHYDLIYRTNSFDQNESRFAEFTLKPDFKFRCRKTQQEFYVEAKYRSGFNAANKIEVISYNQIERFKTYQISENIPIFIVVGYGNSPDNPANVSLIPLEELAYLDLYASFLRRFEIRKGTVNSTILNLFSKEEPNVEGAVIEENNKLTEATPNNLKNHLFLLIKNKKLLIALSIGLILIIIAMFNSSSVSDKEILTERTKDYYRVIHSGNIDDLDNFINPNVKRWYDKTNMTFDEIKNLTLAYNRQHPRTSTEIQWETFNIISLENGYKVSYNMIYKLLKEDKGKDKIYHLKIHAFWDKDLKLKSMYEERI